MAAGPVRVTPSRPKGRADDARPVTDASAVGTGTAGTREETTMGEFTDKAKGLANQAVGKAKQGIGKMTGSESTEAEGTAQKTKGHAQEAVGDAKGAAKGAADDVAGAVKR